MITLSIFCRVLAPLLTILTPVLVFAKAATLSNPVPGAGMTLKDFIFLLLDILQLVLFPVLVVCIIYAGFLMVTAGGDEAQVTKSKMWIMWTLVGAAIIISAKVIAEFIAGTVSIF
jgi:heme/copper-type cytochrome/quinol oxidase subunit 2